MQQKCCDQGASMVVFRIVWPIFLLRSSCGYGRLTEECVELPFGETFREILSSMTHSMSLTGSSPI